MSTHPDELISRIHGELCTALAASEFIALDEGERQAVWGIVESVIRSHWNQIQELEPKQNQTSQPPEPIEQIHRRLSHLQDHINRLEREDWSQHQENEKAIAEIKAQINRIDSEDLEEHDQAISEIRAQLDRQEKAMEEFMRDLCNPRTTTEPQEGVDY